MTAHANLRTSVSALMGATVRDAGGRALGHVKEFAVAPTIDAAHEDALDVRLTGKAASWKRLKRTKHGKLTLVPIASIQLTPAGGMQLRDDAPPIALLDDDNFLLLERDLLDQQIIDVHGFKVVRVNDVELIWECGLASGPDLSLRIAEVEVGTRGAVRRLLKGLPVATVDRIVNRIGGRVIPWDFVDLIDRDPARRVKLKIEQERLSQMHPSDLADILEELAPPERQALFRSLDEEVAAEALEEVEPRLQKALIEGLDSESVAGILEEMDPHERQEVEDLLEFSDNSAAGQMTTEYLALPHTALVSDAIQALSTYEDDIEALTDIYLLEEDGRIHGILPLARLLLAASDAPLSSLPAGHLLCCSVDDSAKKVAEMFDKYNLRSLAVVDDHKQLAGIILAEHVIAQLRAK
jgi:magnesium transporter